MSKLFVYILFFFIISCNNLEFVYNDSDNILNPLYGKTDVKISSFWLDPLLPACAQGLQVDNKYKNI